MELSNQTIISFKTVRLIFLLIILFELLSFLGYFYPWLATAVFFILSGLVLVFSLIRLEYGLYFLLTELFVGSKGYLFHFDFAGISISLRLALFLILIGVWLFRLIQSRFKLNFTRSFYSDGHFRSSPTEVGYGRQSRIPHSDVPIRQGHSDTLFGCANSSRPFGYAIRVLYFLFFIFLAWGVIRGLISKNSFDNLFFDANGWLYFALAFIFFDLVVSERVIKNIFNLFLASISFLALKTIILFYLFSNQIEFLIAPLYRWIRLNGLGEITQLVPFFSRIFLQSQIYLLIGFLLILTLWLTKKFNQPDKKSALQPVLYSACLSTALLISFSRSYWLGLGAGLIGLFLVLKFFQRLSWSKMFSAVGLIILIFVFAFDFIYLLVIFPSQASLTDFSGLVSQRFGLADEPAALSRWQQLGPLWQTIKQRPLFGSGFGTIVTYQSQDPRAIAKSGGQYSTYAFEWGYLDIILKIGFAGLLAYLFLIYRIFKEGIMCLKSEIRNPKSEINSKFQTPNFKQQFVLGLLLGLIALIITNITSPYLNHPLGIGYLMLCSAIFEKLKEPA